GHPPPQDESQACLCRGRSRRRRDRSRLMAVTETSIVVDGVRSPVLQAGPSDATEAVVFVHGNPGSGRDWSDLVATVGDFARAVAPDMPGYASADKPRDFDYTVEGYATHLGGVLSELGIGRVHL